MLAAGSVDLPVFLGRGLCCQLNKVPKVLADDPTVVDDQAPNPPLPLQDINTPGVTEGFVDPSSPHIVIYVDLASPILECLAFNALPSLEYRSTGADDLEVIEPPGSIDEDRNIGPDGDSTLTHVYCTKAPWRCDAWILSTC